MRAMTWLWIVSMVQACVLTPPDPMATPEAEGGSAELPIWFDEPPPPRDAEVRDDGEVAEVVREREDAPAVDGDVTPGDAPQADALRPRPDAPPPSPDAPSDDGPVPPMDVVPPLDRPVAVDAPPDLSSPEAPPPRDASGVDTTPPCTMGFARCGALCVDLTRDFNHCGLCGRACSPGTSCTNGACTTVCPALSVDCGGVCANLRSTPEHCGACGRRCPAPPNATPRCVTYDCTYDCHPGYADCDRNALNGCEVTLANDRNHCGTCGSVCSAAGGIPSCVLGTCQIVCSTGRGNCNGNAGDGCEADLGTNAHCGRCGNACASGQSCSGGVCVPVCPVGQTICAGACVDTARSTTHCGGCGRACAVGQTCVAGVCGVACGTTVCAAGQVCVSGQCLAPCGAGMTRCGVDCVNTQTNEAHCGRCNTPNCLECVAGYCTLREGDPPREPIVPLPR